MGEGALESWVQLGLEIIQFASFIWV